MATRKQLVPSAPRELERTEVRKTGILARRRLTDVILEFTQYCEANGSTHAGWYYANVTTMVYTELGLVDSGYRRKRTRKAEHAGLRGKADADALTTIKVAEDVLAVALSTGMAENQDYKLVYKTGKKAVQKFAGLLGIRKQQPTKRRTHEIDGNL